MKSLPYIFSAVFFAAAILFFALWRSAAKENISAEGRLVLPWELWNEKLADFDMAGCSNLSLDIDDGRLYGIMITYEEGTFYDLRKQLIERYGAPVIDGGDVKVIVWRLNDCKTAMQLSVSDDDGIRIILLPIGHGVK